MVRRGFSQRLGALALTLFGGGFIVRAGEAKASENLIILSFNGPSPSVGATSDHWSDCAVHNAPLPPSPSSLNARGEG